MLVHLLPASLLALALAPLATLAADATPALNNPPGTGYQAILPTSKSSVSGEIQIGSTPSGKGANVQVIVRNLPSEGGPFSMFDPNTFSGCVSRTDVDIAYHIHEYPVPADGNCTGTGAHLDPFGRGEDPPCDDTKPETCQVGDLAGKHGKLTPQRYSDNYDDAFLSLVPGDQEFIGGKSIVVHFANKTRITCADLVLLGGNSTSTNSTSTNSTMTLSLSVPSGTASNTASRTDSSMTSSTASETATGESNAAVTMGAYGLGAGLMGMLAFLL
ncbi:hypothetical protein D0864_01808 [Hortaea werneckii]|nr:hypothetical protein D0864_01808 [Hortaea werneckii]